MSIDRGELESAINLLSKWRGPSHLLHELSDVLDAARAHLETLPKTKMVDVWHVEWVAWTYPDPQIDIILDKISAENHALVKRNNFRCVRVTGPHKHEVPA